MKSKSTPHYIQSETVESLVDRYVNDWSFSYSSTRYEILYNFEMADTEIQKALDYLDHKYNSRKVGNARMVARSEYPRLADGETR